MSAVTAELGGFVREHSHRSATRRRGSSRRAAWRWVSLGLILAGDAAAIGLSVVVAGPSTLDALAYGVSLVGVFVIMGSYRPRLSLGALTEAPSQVGAAAITLLIFGLAKALLHLLKVGDGDSTDVVKMAGAVAVLAPLGRGASYGVVRALRRRRLVRDPVLVIGADQVGMTLARELEDRAEHGLQPVGFVDDIDPAGAPAPLLGELSSLDRVLTEQSVQRIIVAFGAHRERDLVRVLRTALQRDIDVYVVPRLHEIGLDRAPWHVETIACTPLHRARPAAPNMRAWPAKRVFDVLVAGTVLLLLSPLLAILAVGVKLDSPGPVLFRQRRVGQHGRTFQLLKFRSLRVNADSDVRWSVVGDDRQTRLGAWMRRCSVDELPQLWNIVRGDMSLIGPRPERPHFVDEFSDAVAGYEDRHRLPVGLTGWAQVNGLRGDTSIDARAKYDNHYIDHWSLLRDLTILVATASAVLRDARRKPSA
jgi:exopolysaccharide biosynthesis polyprenyl glycosylphosphotransferase